jgi:hypothetical protein
MATWKKVIVSGSSAILSQLNVNSNQQIGSTQATTFLSGSFTGSFTGDGSGLVGVTATAIFPASNLAPLSGSHKVFVNNGSNSYYATVDQFNSSSWANVSGDIKIDGLTGVATIQADSVALGTDTTGNYVADIVSGSNSGIIVSHTPGEGSTATVSLKNNGSLSDNTLVKWTTSGYQLANSTITDDGTTVTIGGNLTVSGTTTYINTTNTAITDQFVLLASGSGATVDGGIIVQNAATAGEAFYWENNAPGTSRWAIASNVSPSATSVAAAEYMVTAKTAAGAPSAAPTYGGSSTGYGNVYVNSSDESIWIYS